MKLPSLLPAIDAALAREQSVVVQLVSTSEALLSRRLADLSAEDRAELDTLDLSPRELVMDYLQAAFPTRAMEVFSDDDGTRSEERRVGNEGVSTCKSRRSPYH